MHQKTLDIWIRNKRDKQREDTGHCSKLASSWLEVNSLVSRQESSRWRKIISQTHSTHKVHVQQNKNILAVIYWILNILNILNGILNMLSRVDCWIYIIQFYKTIRATFYKHVSIAVCLLHLNHMRIHLHVHGNVSCDVTFYINWRLPAIVLLTEYILMIQRKWVSRICF